MNTLRKIGLSTALATLVAVPFAYAQDNGTQGMQGQMMQNGGMMGQGNMSGMMGMMSMMQQMGPMMEACTGMMQAMSSQMGAHDHTADKS